MSSVAASQMDGSVDDQRFRAALISSLAVHAVGLLLAIVLPLILPDPRLDPQILQAQIIQLPPPAQTPVPTPPQPEPEPPEPEPEVEEEAVPVDPVVSDPEPVPRRIEDIRREQEEEERRAAEAEAERRRAAEEARRQREREEEARRQREEEERRKRPQKAARRTPAPEPQQARRQGIDLTGAQSTDSAFSTVEDFPFVDYLMRIRDLIQTRWEPPPRGPYAAERRVEVFFRIGRDGRLVVTTSVSRGSGAADFDQAALRAIANAAPFPPLPRAYDGQSLGVGLAFVQE